MHNSQTIQIRTMLLIGLALALIFIGSLVVWPVSQVQAGATLPSRTASTPTGAGNDQSDDDDSEPVGAYIELQVGAAHAGDWSQVEWQDSNGDWQPVKGWTGTLDAQGQCRWWVAAKDFGTGPFRWVVYRSPDDPIALTSQPFSLPVEARQIVVIAQ